MTTQKTIQTWTLAQLEAIVPTLKAAFTRTGIYSILSDLSAVEARIQELSK